jgi:F-box protein 25/32
MVGAVIDVRRFNYVCKLVQLIINEKLEQLSGNAQRTLFMIVRCMLTQVINTNENLSIMKKLLLDFKKKIQNSYYYYFYYIGSQKLWEKHLNKLTKWINLLLNNENKMRKMHVDGLINLQHYNNHNRNNDEGFAKLPNDCKLEIIRRLNNGLDIVNISKCNRSLHDVISQEIGVWKNLCLYHFQQEKVNQLLKQKSVGVKKNDDSSMDNDLDWKTLYFRLKRRYGHKEVYADMIHKCSFCKCLFWKEIGHPCTFLQDEHETAIEPITPKKLINILLS